MSSGHTRRMVPSTGLTMMERQVAVDQTDGAGVREGTGSCECRTSDDVEIWREALRSVRLCKRPRPRRSGRASVNSCSARSRAMGQVGRMKWRWSCLPLKRKGSLVGE